MGSSASLPSPAFTDPLSHGYLYLDTSVDPRRLGPFVRPNAQRATVLERYKSVAHQLRSFDMVVNATVYEALLMPPLAGMPQFDVIMLVATTAPEALAEVQAARSYSELDPDLTMTHGTSGGLTHRQHPDRDLPVQPQSRALAEMDPIGLDVNEEVHSQRDESRTKVERDG